MLSLPSSSLHLPTGSLQTAHSGLSPLGSHWFSQIYSHPLENLSHVYDHVLGTIENFKTNPAFDQWLEEFVQLATGKKLNENTSASEKTPETFCHSIEEKIGLSNAVLVLTRLLQHTHYVKSQGSIAEKMAVENGNNFLENELKRLLQKKPECLNELTFDLLRLDRQAHQFVEFTHKLKTEDLHSRSSKKWTVLAYSVAALAVVAVASRFASHLIWNSNADHYTQEDQSGSNQSLSPYRFLTDQRGVVPFTKISLSKEKTSQTATPTGIKQIPSVPVPSVPPVPQVTTSSEPCKAGNS